MWGMLKNPAYMGPRRVRQDANRGSVDQRLRAAPRAGQDPTPVVTRPTTRICRSRSSASIPVAERWSAKNCLPRCRNNWLPTDNGAANEKRGARYQLQGLIECGCCGYAYYGKKVSRAQLPKARCSYAYYRCVSAPMPIASAEHACATTLCAPTHLDNAVWNDVGENCSASLSCCKRGV